MAIRGDSGYQGQDSPSNYNNGIAHSAYPSLVASYNVLIQFSKGKDGKVSVSPNNVSSSINGIHLGVTYQQLNNPIISASGSIINCLWSSTIQYSYNWDKFRWTRYNDIWFI